MVNRPFGAHGPEVSILGLGTARLNPLSGVRRFADAAAVVHRCLALGVNFFETADAYGAGWSERWLGKALRNHRAEVMIATKFGLPRSLGDKVVQRAHDRVPIPGWFRADPLDRYTVAYATAAVEQSLRRMGTDHIDVVMLHSPPTSILRDGDWAAALETLRDRGSIRFYGVAARSLSDAIFAIRGCGVDVVQVELNACTLGGASELFAAAAETGTAVVAASRCWAQAGFSSASLGSSLTFRGIPSPTTCCRPCWRIRRSVSRSIGTRRRERVSALARVSSFLEQDEGGRIADVARVLCAERL